MNRNDARKLAGIQAPRSMLKNLIKTEKTFAETKAILEEGLRSSRATLKDKEKIIKALDSPQWERTTQTIDPKVAVQIEKYVEAKVNQAIKDGTLPKPKLSSVEKERLNQYYAPQKS